MKCTIPTYCLLLATLLGAGSTRAQASSVVVSHEAEDQRELVERLSWELRSEGYDVKVAAPGPTPCETGGGAEQGAWGAQEQSWIRLMRDVAGVNRIRALICHRSSRGLLVRATSTGVLSNSPEFAVLLAEALNGVRTRVTTQPQAAPRAQRSRGRAQIGPSARPELQPPRRVAPGRNVASGLTIAGEPPDLFVVAGPSISMSLDLSPSWSLGLETFWPLRDATIDVPGGSLSTRFAWARLGPGVHVPAGPVMLAGAVLVGPTLVWTRAAVAPPDVGAADFAAGALVSLRASCEFPRSSRVFSYAAGGVSQSLPRFRIETGAERSASLGELLLEGSIGLGVRWFGP